MCVCDDIVSVTSALPSLAFVFTDVVPRVWSPLVFPHEVCVCVCVHVGTPVSRDLRRDTSGHVSSIAGSKSQAHNPTVIRGNQLELRDVTSNAFDNCASSSCTPVAERTLPTFCFQWPDEYVFGD